MIVCTAKKNKDIATASDQSSRFVKFFQNSPIDTSQARRISTGRKQQLDEAFMRMVVLDYQPLTLGERDGMRLFANCAVPGYVTPCYDTVRDTLLPAALKEVENKLLSALRGNYNFTVATDIWTSRRGHPFIAFICTYVNENLQGKTVLLACEHMPGHHTGDSIREVFDDICRKWNIHDKIVRVVSDNASNMLSAFRLPGFTVEYEVLFSKIQEPSQPSTSTSGSDERLSGNLQSVDAELTDVYELEMTCDDVQEDENEADSESSESNIESAIESAFFTSPIHLPCPIHTMQLAIKDAFDECDDMAALTTKVSKLVSCIRRSTLNTTFTDTLGVRPSVACVTRWNSQLKMVQSVLKLSERDDDFQSKLTVQETAKLSASDLRSLASLVQALLPLAEMTETLQAEFGSLGEVLPSVVEVRRLLSTIKTPLAVRIFAEVLAKKFEERFQKYYSDVHLIVASVLDPRFKTEWILRDTKVREQILAIRDLVIHKAKEAIEEAARNKIGDTASADSSDHTVQALGRFAAQTPTDTNAASKKQRLMFASYSTPDNAHESSVSAATRTVEQELECYLTSPRLPPTTKVLDFWKANMSEYPQLSQLVRATYGIPSGSASAERCFSAAGLITRVHRLSMKPKTLEKLVFLKVNSALLV